MAYGLKERWPVCQQGGRDRCSPQGICSRFRPAMKTPETVGEVRVDVHVPADGLGSSHFARHFGESFEFVGCIRHDVRVWKRAVSGDHVSGGHWVSSPDRLQVSQKPAFKLLTHDPDQHVPGRFVTSQLHQPVLVRTAVATVIVTHDDETIAWHIPSSKLARHGRLQI